MTARTPRWRWRELSLLWLPFLALGAGLALLALDNLPVAQWQGPAVTPPVSAFVPLAVIAGLALASHGALSLFLRRADQILLPAVIMLATIGVLMMVRLQRDPRVVGGAGLGQRQVLWVAIGLALTVGVAIGLRQIDWLRRYKYTWAVLGFLLMMATLAHGVTTDPNMPGHDSLYLGVGFLRFQPSEILKVLLVIFFAGYLDEYREVLAYGSFKLGPLRLPPLGHLGPILVMWGMSLALLMVQKELGTALLFFGVFLSVIYLASERMSYVVSGLTLFAAGAVVCYSIFGYVQTRVAIAIDPWPFADNKAYQIVQGLLALGSGGVFGAGLGLGDPGAIPVVQNDFTFVAVGEELGLMGLVAVLGLYAVIVWRGFHIAIQARTEFQRLLAGGLTSALAIQTFVIVAGNAKLLPLTGITLPFISYGGSSILTNFIIIGLLLRISAASHQPQPTTVLGPPRGATGKI